MKKYRGSNTHCHFIIEDVSHGDIFNGNKIQKVTYFSVVSEEYPNTDHFRYYSRHRVSGYFTNHDVLAKRYIAGKTVIV